MSEPILPESPLPEMERLRSTLATLHDLRQWMEFRYPSLLTRSVQTMLVAEAVLVEVIASVNEGIIR
jgi:hypothetical protein